MTRSAVIRAMPPVLLAVVTLALAFYSPIEEAKSDPGIALLATQSLLDHGTLRLDAYLNDPACAYDLESDYRIRRRGESFTYYSHGVSLLSLPSVWLANRMGFHMLEQSDELALQNLLSALCCALLGLLFYRICRAYLAPLPSLTISSISLLGSSLISTMATGLWNVGYEALLLALGLLHLVHAEARGTRFKAGYLVLLAGLAFLCRPTAAFAGVAALPALAPAEWFKKWRIWLPLVLGLTLLAALLIVLDLMRLIPRYYSPLKLTPQSPVLTGLHGILLSPSRGLLVFSPFLVPVAAVCLWRLRALASDRLFRLAAVWGGLHLLAIATKGVWWGGHSFGPRLLSEVMLPAVIITCLAWRQLERPRLILFATVYLICGLVAIYIHSYQGLFNDQARRWNWMPDIDRAPRLVFDWRYPQFLATASSIERRALELERLKLGTYELGVEINPEDPAVHGALLHDWYLPEPGWRWSRGNSPEILLNLGGLPSDSELYLFRFRAGALGRQQAGFEVNGTMIDRIELDGSVEERAFAFEPGLLQPERENRFRFDLPGASSTPTDQRILGLALRSFSLRSVTDFPGIVVADEPLFIGGFSITEKRWRWTDRRRAALDYPVADPTGLDTLELIGSALQTMPVAIRINGIDVGELTFDGGFENVVAQRLTIDPSILRPFRMNRIVLLLPEARRTPTDARLLGLAFRRLELRPASSATP